LKKRSLGLVFGI
jgi:hypothetical protein